MAELAKLSDDQAKALLTTVRRFSVADPLAESDATKRVREQMAANVALAVTRKLTRAARAPVITLPLLTTAIWWHYSTAAVAHASGLSYDALKAFTGESEA